MKKLTTLPLLLLAIASALFTACDLDRNSGTIPYFTTALVTVKPQGETFYMQLDDTTRLLPTNIVKAPFGSREVRALVNFTYQQPGDAATHRVLINWLDSIRTKPAVPTLGDARQDSLAYGDDPVEIVRDWVTVAEDGYLTLRLRTMWGYNGTVHYFNLITGTNADNPYEVVLRHDAKGDVAARQGDALIAFNVRQLLPEDANGKVTLTLRWNSFSGPKHADFQFSAPPSDATADLTGVLDFAKVTQ